MERDQWLVHARVLTVRDGWSCSHGVASFYIDAGLTGTCTAEAALRCARNIVDPLRVADEVSLAVYNGERDLYGSRVIHREED
jgi:hypothetical protein